ncbi:GDP-mannose 4,6-dehydratase, partial [Campylobacter jejuni]
MVFKRAKYKTIGKIMKKTVLITGFTGQVGSQMVDFL